MFGVDSQHALPCCAGGGGSRTPCGRNTAAPSQGCSACGLCQATLVEMCYTMVSEVVRELLGFPLGCRRFFVGVVRRTSSLLEMLCAWSSDLRSSDLSSRAAPRCLFCAWVSDLSSSVCFRLFFRHLFRRALRRAASFCAWVSDLRFKCLFSIFF